MIGRRFGRLVVTALSENTSGKRKRLMYYCDCGRKNIEIIGEKLRSGHTKSCGCLNKEIASIIHKKYNQYDLSGEYGIGFTSNTHKKFYFDLEDYYKIKEYCWQELSNGYIASRDQKQKFIYLHRIIMDANKNEIVDHKKHNLFDNRKEFLRKGTQSNNMMNTSMRRDNTSGFTGVSLNARTGNWISELRYNKKKIYLGSFHNRQDAINARIAAEEKYFNDWSYKNSNGKYNNEKEKK